MLPDSLIIGAMKAGTSSLFHYLASHPQVVPSSIKETDFFFSDRNYERGVSWYESLFSGAGSHALEASPNYTKRHLKPGMPARIHQLIPAVKMVFVARDPVERLISHYVHNLDHGRERRPFDEAIVDVDSNYYQTSRYFFQIEAFLEHFPSEQLFVVQSEQLRSDTAKVVAEVCSFFGLSDECDPAVMEKAIHPSSAKTTPSRLERALLKLPLQPGAKDLIKRKTKSLRKPIARPKPSADQLNRIKDALAEDAAKLREFANQEFADWCV